MRGKDGRWLFTAPCGKRAKLSSKRCTPVYTTSILNSTSLTWGTFGHFCHLFVIFSLQNKFWNIPVIIFHIRQNQFFETENIFVTILLWFSKWTCYPIRIHLSVVQWETRFTGLWKPTCISIWFSSIFGS